MSWSLSSAPLPLVENPNLQRVATEEGLTQGSVYSLLQDRQGFLWLATEGGLSRYDGYRVLNYQGEGRELADKIIYSLYYDSRGEILVGTESHGLYRLNPERGELEQVLVHYFRSDPDLPQQVDVIIEDEKDNLWLGLLEDVVYFDVSTGEYEVRYSLSEEERAAHEMIRAMEYVNGHLFIGTSTGLRLLDIETGDVRDLQLANNNLGQHSRNVKQLHIDKQGQLWVGTVAGLFRFQRHQVDALLKGDNDPVAELIVDGLNIWHILPDGDDFLLGTNQGLYRLDAEQNLQFVLRLSDGLFHISDDSILKILKDHQSNLWMATKSDGVFRWSPDSAYFTNLHKNNRYGQGINHDNIWSLHQDAQGMLWIGSEDGLNRYDPSTQEMHSFAFNLEQQPAGQWEYGATEIFPAGDGKLWVNARSSLRLFDPEQGLVVESPLDDKLPDYPWGTTMDEHGDLWFVTQDGFYRYRPESDELIRIEALNGMLDPAWAHGFIGTYPGQPNKLLISMTGSLWSFDSDSGDLTKLHALREGQLSAYQGPESVVLDEYGVLWIAYSGYGLFGLDAGTLEQKFLYRKQDKLSSDAVYGLQLDSEGNLWMSSHGGLMRLNTKTQHIRHFTHMDGLATNEFNAGAYTHLADGRLAYGSMKGVTLFDPQSYTDTKETAPASLITELDLLSAPLDMPLSDLSGRELTLEHDDVGLKVSFSTLNYGNLEQTLYQYSITGKDNIDYPPTRNAQVLIPKLRSGDHQFKVSAIDPRTGEMGPAASLSIRVRYPPWGSPLAYAFYALIVLVLMSWWWRRKNLQARELTVAHQALQMREEQLQLALSGSNSGVWDWQSNTGLMYQPRLKQLGYTDTDSITIEHYIELLHPHDKAAFEQNWSRFIQGEADHFDLSYRIRDEIGQWHWYRDLGRVVEWDKDEGISRISGTCTDVTHTRVNEEKLRLFGEAFRHTRDWVLIFNSERLPIAANQAFCEALGIDSEADIGLQLQSFISNEQRLFYRRVMGTLEAGQHWRGELDIEGQDNRLHNLMVSINAVSAESYDEISHYIVVMTDISEQKSAQEELRLMANYDSLTGLPNRNLLLDRIQHGIDHARRARQKLAVLFIDLDKFKQVNDSLGHEAGDQLLLEIAARLKDSLRLDDTVGRLGGDEFVVVIEDIQDKSRLAGLARKIIAEIDQPIAIGNHKVSVSASVGIALYPDDAKAPSDLLKSADIAMYQAKANGRNRHQYFTLQMNQQVHNRLLMENRLKAAFKKGEFENHYQPIVDIESGQTVGFELLLRWRCDGEMISPGEFIPLAEELGLIVPMTWQAMDRGMLALSHWHATGTKPYLAINLSARHFEAGLRPEEVVSRLNCFGLPVSAIRFEITEGVLMKDYDKSRSCMQKLHNAGLRFSLDDFGTGYSSLKYLKDFPIQTIKIDQSFVRDIGVDHNDEAIIKTTLLMAESLNMNCVAEGIETPEQVAFFKQQGCKLLQGFLFSRPQPASEIPAMLGRDWRKMLPLSAKSQEE
ncbi:EAL domain-containing protein [Lacimicrobium alkaliphilum]|uniref:EAL domain-containing protein n=1 Tax=Lacimicrobium alkaliphilum TaxID=1526571 RepID=UPI0015D4ED35|nr:EAL domain-containing protein [Lacimicrobium alkaliphilum]